jgi:hypothetical protein
MGSHLCSAKNATHCNHTVAIWQKEGGRGCKGRWHTADANDGIEPRPELKAFMYAAAAADTMTAKAKNQTTLQAGNFSSERRAGGSNCAVIREGCSSKGRPGHGALL